MTEVNAQMDNALKMAWDAYDASNEEEAKNFFNQALTIDPNSTIAKVGKGCSVLISFTLAQAASDAQQAYSYWEQASHNGDFSDNERSLISKSAIKFTELWKTASENHYKQFKDLDSSKNEWNQTRKNIAIFLYNISTIGAMSEYSSYLEKTVQVISTINVLGSPGEISKIKTDIERLYFFAKHPFKNVIRKSEEVLLKRTDYDGNPKFDFSFFGNKKYEFKGKIDIIKDTLKINDLKVQCIADEESLSIVISYNGSLALKKIDDVYSALTTNCKKWKIEKDKDTLKYSINNTIINSNVLSYLDIIHSEIDEIKKEGELILTTINENGGKLSLLGSLFGKK